MVIDRDALILENLALAHHQAARESRASMLEHDEARAVAYLGLTQAAKEYDPTRGVAFSTYAVTCIRNRIIDAAYAQSSLIRWPRAVAPALIRKNKESEAFGAERAVRATGWECDRDLRAETPPSEESELREAVARAIDRLESRTRQIVRYRFGFQDGASHTLDECEEKFGISRERIRQIETAALVTLRLALEPVL